MSELPKVIHQIWLGGAPIPGRLRAFQDGWRKLHPGWEWRLWTDENRFELTNERSFAAAASNASRADILRYEIVHRLGGVYLDLDMECLRPIDPLFAARRAFYACFEDTQGIISNAFFAACPGSLVLKRAIASIPRRMAVPSNAAVETGPVCLTAAVLGEWRNEPVTIFPRETFYPYYYTETHRASERFRETVPAAFAAHHWAGSWKNA